jgi:Catalase
VPKLSRSSNSCQPIAALAFVTTPRPVAVSYGTQPFFGVNAFKFTNGQGTSKCGRYRIVPESGPAYVSDEEAAKRTPNALADNLRSSLEKGLVKFRLLLQVIAPGASITNARMVWPEPNRSSNSRRIDASAEPAWTLDPSDRGASAHNSRIPSLSPIATASVRLWAPNFASRDPTWNFAVDREMRRSRAIILLDAPAASFSRTSSSRAVKCWPSCGVVSSNAETEWRGVRCERP